MVPSMQPMYRAEQSAFQQVVKGTVLRLVIIFWKIPGPLGVCESSNILKLLSQNVVANRGIFGFVSHLILDALSGSWHEGSSLISWA